MSERRVGRQSLYTASDNWGYVMAVAAFLATAIDQFAPMFPDKWKPIVLAIGGLCVAIASVKTRKDVKKAANEGGN